MRLRHSAGQWWRMGLRKEIRTDGQALIFWALCLLTLPLCWVLAVVMAVWLHEMCHLLVLWILKIPVSDFHVSFSGVKIKTGPMTEGQELAVAAAGPIGSLGLLLLIRWFPELALAGAVQGLYNLIPIYPFDGGRILRCILSCLFPKSAEVILKLVETVFCVMLLPVGCVLIQLFPRWRVHILLSCFLVLRASFRKIPCNDGAFAIQ